MFCDIRNIQNITIYYFVERGNVMFEFYEAINRIVKNPKRNLCIMCLSLIAVLNIAIAYGMNEKVENQNAEYNKKYNEKRYYTLIDNFVGENELEINRESFELLKKINNILCNSKDFEYYMLYNQPIYIQNTEVNDNVLYGYEHGKTYDNSLIQIYDVEKETTEEYLNVKAFWIDEKYNNDYGFSLSEGELFSKEDFKNEDTSIILGSSYKDIFNVGDEINIDFFYFKGKAVIKGFLEEGTNIYYDSTFINMNNYIIVPMPNRCSVSDVWKDVFFMYMKNSGLIVSDKTEKGIQKIINDYMKELNLENCYYIKEYGKTELNTMTISLKKVSNVVKIIALLVVITITIFMIIYYWKIFGLSKNYFAVLLLNGCGYKDLKSILFLENFIMVIISYFVGICTLIFFNNSFNIQTNNVIVAVLFFVILLYQFIPLLIVMNVFFRKDLTEYLKEEVLE